MKNKTTYLWVALLISIIFWFVTGAEMLEKHRYYKFNQQLWKQSTPEQRYYMARFLQDNGAMIGKTYAEIIEQLGEPKSIMGDPSENHGFTLHYYLGPERGFIKMDGILLDVIINSNKIVASTRIHVT